MGVVLCGILLRFWDCLHVLFEFVEWTRLGSWWYFKVKVVNAVLRFNRTWSQSSQYLSSCNPSQLNLDRVRWTWSLCFDSIIHHSPIALDVGSSWRPQTWRISGLSKTFAHSIKLEAENHIDEYKEESLLFLCMCRYAMTFKSTE